MSNTFALIPVFQQKFTDNDFSALVGGKLYSYEAGTSTPLATYTDSTGSTPNQNPVILDSTGAANIWMGAGAYKFVLEDANGNVLKTEDGVVMPGSAISILLPNQVTGVLDFAHGGTGASTQGAALTALAGTQGSGEYLRSDGTNTSLSAIQVADVPTLNQNTTGMASNITATSNSTLTTLSSLSLPASQITSQLPVANGGTGQSTANSGLNALLPSQTGNSGKVLSTNGLNSSWISSAVSPTAPTIQKFLTVGTQTGLLFNITAPASAVTAGAVYTNNSNSYTVLNSLTTSQSGWILFTSGTGSTSGTTLTKSSGTGPTTITFSATEVLATYTTPISPGPLYLRVKTVGGGGGGGAGGSGGAAGNAGTPSAFGSAVLIAGSGSGGAGAAGAGAVMTGGAGGNATANSPALQVVAVSGGQGQAGLSIGGQYPNGGSGGNSFFGGGGGGGGANQTGYAASTNSGSGGGGSVGGNNYGAAGGGAGGYIEALITTPSSTYVYSVGTGGLGGSSGANAGGSGVVIVEEFYQ